MVLTESFARQLLCLAILTVLGYSYAAWLFLRCLGSWAGRLTGGARQWAYGGQAVSQGVKAGYRPGEQNLGGVPDGNIKI